MSRLASQRLNEWWREKFQWLLWSRTILHGNKNGKSDDGFHPIDSPGYLFPDCDCVLVPSDGNCVRRQRRRLTIVGMRKLNLRLPQINSRHEIFMWKLRGSSRIVELDTFAKSLIPFDCDAGKCNNKWVANHRTSINAEIIIKWMNGMWKRFLWRPNAGS